MNLFKKSTMSLALTGLLGGGALMGVSAPVQAVNVAHDGLGEVMVFPYYTVRGGWSTFFNITNTSAEHTVIMKVRWREAVNSRDARDFNVILSPNDVWTAATVPGTGGAKMVTSDNSCTFPELPADGDLTGIAFTNAAYTGPNADGGDDRLDRTREGYFEVLEMGTIVNNAPNGPAAASIANGALHDRVGNNTAFPNSCGAVRNRLREAQTFQGIGANLAAELDEPLNLLKGRAVLINSSAGVAAGYDPLTLANFADTQIYAAPELPIPNLSSAVPLTGSYYDDQTNAIVNVVPTVSAADVVSGIIARTGVINDYNVATDSETDWVVTFPTKNFYVDRAQLTTDAQAAIPFGAVAPLAPFDAGVRGQAFNSDNEGRSCFDVGISIWDREEFDTPPPTTEDQFSPFIPGNPPGQDVMCYEANILSFGESNVFNSRVRRQVTALPGDNGWARLSFGTNGGTNVALPVIGMRMEERNQGDSTINFGFANDHAYERATQTAVARPAN